MNDTPSQTPPIAIDALVDRARSGDAAAYEQLFALVADRLQLFIRARLGPGLRREVETVDVLQEAFAAGHRDFSRFAPRDPEAFLRWLFRVAENRMRDQARAAGAAKRKAPGDELPVSKVLRTLRESGHGPCTIAARREQRADLERALDDLEDDERAVLLMRFFEECTVDDMSERLGRSPSATRRLLGRAIRRLGQRLPSGETTGRAS